jgi:hypothetical protein
MIGVDLWTIAEIRGHRTLVMRYLAAEYQVDAVDGGWSIPIGDRPPFLEQNVESKKLVK